MNTFNNKDSIYTIKELCKPEFFRITNSKDKSSMDELLKRDVQLFDQLHGQLRELLKLRNPKINFSKEGLNAEVEKYLDGVSIYEYGVWVYYPWTQRLVHILDEKEFIEVRTSRNQHKITNEEQELLLKRKIGVIGLSVGQSVSVTLALERICGELRIADFDILELSNLNRIRTGLHNIGIKKTISVAREIAEIDPFLKVVCFHDGISEDNIEDFMLEGGKLDVLIDECDGLDVKIMCRQKAKSFNIPVVMEASDRGTIDVERFDLEVNRPILHGFIDHLDVSKIKDLETNEQKIPYLLSIAGGETISNKAKASMLEVAQSITTWPQLGSAVTFGGGITADVCRRILLNEFTDSGRYFIDLDELIKNKDTDKTEKKLNILTSSIKEVDMLKLIQSVTISLEKNRTQLSAETVEAIVEAGIMAPTRSNAQPWKWRYHDKDLYLFSDIIYKSHLTDFKETESIIGLGAAMENVILKAHSLGYEVVLNKFPIKNNDKLISVFSFFKKEDSANVKKLECHICDELAEVITMRSTNRKNVSRKSVDPSILNNLQQIAKTIQGANVDFIEDEERLSEIGDIIAEVERIRIMHIDGHKDFYAEMRWTSEQAAINRKGIDINTLELPPSGLVGMQMIKDWEVINNLVKWNKGKALGGLSGINAKSASAIGLITMPSQTSLDFQEGGRAMERVWLRATMDNLSFHPFTIATPFFHTFLNVDTNLFSEDIKSKLTLLRTRFKKVFPINENAGEIMLFRIFVAGAPTLRSLRVPVQEVLSFSKD